MMKKVSLLLVLLLLLNLMLGAISVLAADPPAAPSSLNAEVVSGKVIKLTWTDKSDDETGFTVERGASENGPYSVLPVDGSGLPTVLKRFDETWKALWPTRMMLFPAGSTLPVSIVRFQAEKHGDNNPAWYWGMMPKHR